MVERAAEREAAPEGGARLSVFLGKGGVGRTTVAAAFALERASAGERVLLVSLVNAREVEARLRAEGGREGLPAALSLATLDARALVDDVVRRATKLGAMADLVIRQPGYESLMDIAPGVKEMAVLNRVHNLRSGPYDRIVLDGPATGHGLHFLEAPVKLAKVLVGRLRERAEDVRATLQDPEKAEVVIVTLPEETPVRETLELAASLRKQGFHLNNVVVNKWLPRVFEDAGARRVIETLERDDDARAALESGVARETRMDAGEWLRASFLVRAQRAEAGEHLRLLESLGASVSLVPYFPDTEGRLQRVARAMREPPAKGVPA